METKSSDNFTLSMTEVCQDMVESAISSRPKGDALRIGVKTSGCNGYSYFMEFNDVDTPVQEGDVIFEFSKIKLISDPKSLLILNGLQIDYVSKGLKKGFEFSNPNAKNECGCGESFNV